MVWKFICVLKITFRYFFFLLKLLLEMLKSFCSTNIDTMKSLFFVWWTHVSVTLNILIMIIRKLFCWKKIDKLKRMSKNNQLMRDEFVIPISQSHFLSASHHGIIFTSVWNVIEQIIYTLERKQSFAVGICIALCNKHTFGVQSFSCAAHTETD